VKKLISYCFGAVLICGLCSDPVFAATDKTFGSGSLIIPMDGSTYQPSSDGGIYVAYGLVYRLLANKAADGVTPDPIPVYWIINDQKTSITGADLTISSTTDPVAKEYKVGAQIPISGVGTSISYSGGPFVIDSANAAAAEAIWANGFQNVNLHVAKVPFTAPVQRELFGSPPKIALLNDSESRTGNATKILADYLQAAGIVNDTTKCNPLNAPVSGPGCVYDVLTPNEVAGIKTIGTPNLAAGTLLNGQSLLFNYSCSGCATQPIANYNLLWVPHWVAGTAKIGQYKSFNPLVGTMPATATDGDDTIMAVRDFVSLGMGVFAECAGIESFESSKYGRFLTHFGLGQNGGSDNSSFIYYNKNALNQPFAQAGSFGFDPQGGHLHNWRPFQVGDTSVITPPLAMAFNPSASNPKSTYAQANTSYDSTVTVFTYDDPPQPPQGTSPAPDIHNYQNGDQAYDQWHYYVGGNMDGDKVNGTVVYLGGHTYVSCGTGGSTSAVYDHEMKFTFSQDMSLLAGMSLTVAYKVGSSNANNTMTINGITAANLTTMTTTSADGNLTVDFANAAIAGTDITGIHFLNGNTSAQLTISSVKFSWTVPAGGTLTTIFDVTENTNVEKTPASTYTSGTTATLSGEILNSGGYASGCVPQGSSGAGIRYVLNTLFQLDTVLQTQYVRSAPIVYQDFLYQGSFDYPAYSGHFRKFQVNADLGSGQKGLKLNTGFGISGDAATLLTSNISFSDANNNKSVDAGELSGRNIYASTETGLESGAVLKDNTLVKPFTFENANLFQPRMSVLSALTLSQTQGVISQRYGMTYSSYQGWYKQPDAMGGVEHSAPAIVGPSTLTSTTRPTMAYVGALDGMIHAFQAGVNSAASPTNPGEISGAGKELWAFIPSSQEPKLQYFRSPNVISNYPAVDASLAYSEVPDPNTSGAYLTVLLGTMGVGGNSLIALDVTNPTASTPAKPKLLWERSGVDVASGTVTMGNGSKVAIGQVRNLAGQTEYRAFITTALKDKVACQDQEGVPLTNGSLCGGIQVYVFDLLTGTQKWRFQRVYNSGVNDVPGSLALVDVDQNGAMDYVVIGDMEGNLWLLPTVPDYDKDLGEDTVIMADSDLGDSLFSSSSPGVISDIPPLYAPSRDEPACTGGLTPLTSTTPCYEAGQDQPIGISTTVVTRGGRTFLSWATGGAQWAGDSYYYAMYVLDITAVNAYKLLDANGKLKDAHLVYKTVLDQGEKAFGAITYSEGYFYFATAFGQIEGLNPKDNVSISQKGNIRAVSSSDNSQNWKYAAPGKFRGSVFVSKGEIYATTLDGKIVDVGSGSFAPPSVLKWFKVKSWREIFDLGTNQ